ncbi:MAG TPA: hypothetical protein QGF58_20840 [Myxococcota bacterium]|nr:hypothetical protein [Myxococcota bacterium]
MPKDAEVWGFYFAAMGAFHGLLAPLVVATSLPLFPLSAFMIGGGTGYIVGLALHGLGRGAGLVPVGFIMGGLWGATVGGAAGLCCHEGANIVLFGVLFGAISGALQTAWVVWPFATRADRGEDPGPLIWAACALSPVAPFFIASGLGYPV